MSQTVTISQQLPGGDLPDEIDAGAPAEQPMATTA
jgi:hypothetical protein